MPFNAVNIGTNTGASGTTLAVTVPAAGVPAGSLIVVAVTEKSTSGTSGTLADTASNTWNTSQGVNLAALAADGRGTVFFAFNSKKLVSGNTITYTRNLSGASCAMSACYFQGILQSSNPEDTAARASATGTTGTITVTSGTPANAGDLFVGVLLDSGSSVAGGNATFTQASTWAIPPNEATTGGSGGSRVDGGWKRGSGTSTQTYNPTLSSTAQQWGLLITAFRMVPDVVKTTELVPFYYDKASYLRYWDLFEYNPPLPKPPLKIQRPPLRGLPEQPGILLQTWTSSTPIWLLPTTVQRPLNQFDWPLPYPTYWYRDWIEFGNTLPPFPTPFKQTDWPLTPSRYWDIFWSQSPKPVPITPIYPSRNYDWPLPPVSKQYWDIFWSQQPYEVKVTDIYPSRNFDWPNPPPVYWYREWIQSGLLEEEPFPPFHQHDWPNPQPVYWYREWVDKRRLETPVRQQDWPIPPRVLWDQFWSQGPYQVPITPTYPSRNYDWPNPTQPWRLDQFWSQDLRQLPFFVFAVPFNQLDWPLPQPVTWDRFWTQSPAPVPVTPTYPYRTYDWPNPTPLPRLDQFWSGKSQLETPLRQLDWPLPYPVYWYRDWTQSGLLVEPIPFLQMDWPLPGQPTRLDQFWAVSLSELPIPSVIFPAVFGQTDWPLPKPIGWYQDFNQNIILLFPPPPPPVTTDIHFKPFLVTFGRMGSLGGLS